MPCLRHEEVTAVAEGNPEHATKAVKNEPVVWQKTDSGCIFLAVLILAVCSAAGGIFKVAVDGGVAWAGVIAVVALSGMGVGVAHCVTRGNG
jgi:hypothetical protein